MESSRRGDTRERERGEIMTRVHKIPSLVCLN